VKKILSMAFVAALAACNAGGTTPPPPAPPPVGGTATYRAELSGTLNAGATFAAAYATVSGQAEQFSTTLPASKEFAAGASDYVLVQGTVSGGGTITVKAFKNNVLCEEKTLAISATGLVGAACNKP
jgi:hypothetical protein